MTSRYFGNHKDKCFYWCIDTTFVPGKYMRYVLELDNTGKVYFKFENGPRQAELTQCDNTQYWSKEKIEDRVQAGSWIEIPEEKLFHNG